MQSKNTDSASADTETHFSVKSSRNNHKLLSGSMRTEKFDSEPFSLAYCLLFHYSLKSLTRRPELTAPFRSDWCPLQEVMANQS